MPYYKKTYIVEDEEKWTKLASDTVFIQEFKLWVENMEKRMVEDGRLVSAKSVTDIQKGQAPGL